MSRRPYAVTEREWRIGALPWGFALLGSARSVSSTKALFFSRHVPALQWYAPHWRFSRPEERPNPLTKNPEVDFH